MSPEEIDALTPDVAAEIDQALRAHVTAQPGAQNALFSGGLGAAVAAPLIKIVLAKLLPVLEDQALKLLDAEIAKIQAAHPAFDLSFVHGLVATLFAAIGSSSASVPSGQAGLV